MSPLRPQPCLGHCLQGSARRKLIYTQCKKGARSRWSRIQFIVLVIAGDSSYSPSFLLPSFNLTFPLVSHSSSSCYSKLQRTKKRRKKKKHVCEGKEADGLARGERTASLSRPQSGGAFLVFLCLVCGYNLLNSRHMTCCLPSLPPPRQPWSALFRGSIQVDRSS